MADKVLCDVVCSGLGVIRRKPEIKYKKMEHLEDIPKVQSLILETASNYVKLGGTLIYSTCTYSVEENEEISFMVDIYDYILKIASDKDRDEIGFITIFTSKL